MDPPALNNLLNELHITNENNASINWTDEYFKNDFMDKNKLSGRLPLLQTVEYSKGFLNWYISGKGGGKLLDLWIGVIGGMLVPTTSISHEYLIIDSMFRGKIGENQTIKLDPLEPVSKLTEFIYANEGPAFSSCEAKTWYFSIYDMLDGKNSVRNAAGGVPASVILAINYLGYIALTLLKVLVKDASKISQHITKNVTNEFNSFWNTSNSQIKFRTPPPHKFAIHQYELRFQKTSPICNKALTFVVATYVYTESFYKPDIRNILKTACLDYLDLYGMGCLYWLQKAQESCSTSAERLMESMVANCHRETNRALSLVQKYYVNSTGNQQTWRWARLFVDKAFNEISISKNPEYAATMAALSSKCDEKSPIWKITQFRDEHLKHTAIRIARTITKALKPSHEPKQASLFSYFKSFPFE